MRMVLTQKTNMGIQASEPEHWSKQYWERWIVEKFSKSPVMRKYLETVKQWYPAHLYELAQVGAKLADEMNSKRTSNMSIQ
jgi:hypothetical protein